MSVLEIVLCGLAGVVCLMTVLWCVSLRLKEADIVDFGWAASVGLLGVWYAVAGSGDPVTRFMLALCSGVWGGRLSAYLFTKRVLKPGEDGRYATLRASWGEGANAKFFLFFQAQAFLAFVLSMSFVVVAFHDGSSSRLIQIIGLLIMAASLAGESAADLQLSRFVSDGSNRGQVCQVGLWNYSRHPNYFFEWLGWCSYPLIAWGASLWWLTLFSPLLILFLILKVTGIPPTEARALESRGEAYRRYQRTTSAFIPWFPRTSKESTE
jgi:steroid 5-alpha reductase family enzyme